VLASALDFMADTPDNIQDILNVSQRSF